MSIVKRVIDFIAVFDQAANLNFSIGGLASPVASPRLAAIVVSFSFSALRSLSKTAHPLACAPPTDSDQRGHRYSIESTIGQNAILDAYLWAGDLIQGYHLVGKLSGGDFL